MKLFFPHDAVVSGEVIYKAGSTHEVSDELGSASRWIKRGAVVVAEDSVSEDSEGVNVAIKPSKKETKKEK